MDEITFNPNNLSRQVESDEEYEAILKDLKEKLLLKYSSKQMLGYSGRQPFIPKNLENILEPVRKAFGGIKNVAGKRILDLGCGGSLSYDFPKRLFEPWFCRALQELGANVVGVDNRPLNDKEEFEHYNLDLSKPEALSIFPDESFDGVNLNSFFDSPDLIHQSFDPSKTHQINEKDMKNWIGAQIKRLLKKDAKFVHLVDSDRQDIKKDLGL